MKQSVEAFKHFVNILADVRKRKFIYVSIYLLISSEASHSFNISSHSCALSMFTTQKFVRVSSFLCRLPRTNTTTQEVKDSYLPKTASESFLDNYRSL